MYQSVPAIYGSVCLQKYVRVPKMYMMIQEMQVLAPELFRRVPKVYTKIAEVHVRVPQSVAEDPRILNEGQESESEGPISVT